MQHIRLLATISHDMKDLNTIRTKIVGKTVTGLYHTPLEAGAVQLDGLGTPQYFSTVLEFDNSEKYEFGFDWITKWDKNEKLIEVNHFNWNIDKKIVFKRKSLKEIILDEVGDVFLRLDNDVIIYQGNFNGVTLHVQEYSELFEKDGTFKV